MSKPDFKTIAGNALTIEDITEQLESMYEAGKDHERARAVLHIRNMAQIHRNRAVSDGNESNKHTRLRNAEELGRAANEIERRRHWTMRHR